MHTLRIEKWNEVTIDSNEHGYIFIPLVRRSRKTKTINEWMSVGKVAIERSKLIMLTVRLILNNYYSANHHL